MAFDVGQLLMQAFSTAYHSRALPANATGPISLCVFSDDNNDREEEGFNVNYLMLAC